MAWLASRLVGLSQFSKKALRVNSEYLIGNHLIVSVRCRLEVAWLVGQSVTIFKKGVGVNFYFHFPIGALGVHVCVHLSINVDGR